MERQRRRHSKIAAADRHIVILIPVAISVVIVALGLREDEDEESFLGDRPSVETSEKW